MKKSQVDRVCSTSKNLRSESNSSNPCHSETSARIDSEQLHHEEKLPNSDSPQRQLGEQKTKKKLIDYTKSRARGATLCSQALNDPQGKSPGSKRRNLFRSNTTLDALPMSSKEGKGDEETIDFFLKVPARNTSRRRQSDSENGRIHNCQVMQEFRDSFHRRKLSLSGRRRSSLSRSTPSDPSTPGTGRSGGDLSSSSTTNLDDLDDDDREAMLRILASINSESESSNEYNVARRESVVSVGRRSDLRGLRPRSSIIKRSIESLHRRHSYPKLSTKNAKGK
jgi:hypothetical protein